MAPSKRILLVDDDVQLCSMLADYLRPEGYDAIAVHNCEAGLAQARAGGYVLAVLDVTLPDGSGLELLRQVRAQAVTPLPVLMLTARGEDTDRIVGLELGADDYLAKPFNPRELVARIRAVLRRSVPPAAGAGRQAERLAVGEIELDTGTYAVRCQGRAVALTVMEFDLLAALLRRPGALIKREELYRDVLAREFKPYDRSLDVHISNLRKKLGPDAKGAPRIRSLRGVGYMYASPAGAK